MKSLKSKLIAFNIFLMAVFGIVVVSLALVQVRSNLLQQIEREFNEILAVQETMTKLWLSEKTRQVTAQSETLFQENSQSYLKLGAQAGGFYAMYAGFTDGRSVFSDGWVPPDDYKVTERDWYKNAAQSQQALMTAPYIDASSKELTVTVAAPVLQDGKLKAVIGGDVFVKDLVKTLLAQTIHKTGYFFLVDKTGVLIAHPNPELTLKPLSSIAPQLTAPRLAEIAAGADMSDVRMAGTDMFVALFPIAGTDWLIGATAEKEVVLAPLYHLIYAVLGVTFLVFLLTIPFSNIVLGRMLRGLLLLKAAMVDISKGDGDLTLRLPAVGKDEISATAHAFNAFVEKLNILFGGLKTDANDVIAGVQEANSLVLHVADSSQKMSNVATANAATLQQISAGLAQISGNAHSADLLTAATSQELSGSADKMQSLSDGMAGTAQSVSQLEIMLTSLKRRSEDIQGVTNVIREIADQTNLLALNAAIEAARAGEGGRGFAVVADEVRKLAERTAQATKEIASTVSAIHLETGRAATDVHQTVISVNGGVSLTREAVKNIEDTRLAMADVVGRMREIVQATTEQSQATAQIVSNSDSLYGEVQDTLKQTGDALEHLAESVGKMDNEFSRFKL